MNLLESEKRKTRKHSPPHGDNHTTILSLLPLLLGFWEHTHTCLACRSRHQVQDSNCIAGQVGSSHSNLGMPGLKEVNGSHSRFQECVGCTVGDPLAATGISRGGCLGRKNYVLRVGWLPRGHACDPG